MSGVGVHLIFIAIVMIYLGMILSSKDKRPPAALLNLDLLTIAKDTGSFQQDTPGHPRCLGDDSVSVMEFGKALIPFVDVVWMIIAHVFPRTETGRGTTTQTTTSNKNNMKDSKSDCKHSYFLLKLVIINYTDLYIGIIKNARVLGACKSV